MPHRDAHAESIPGPIRINDAPHRTALSQIARGLKKFRRRDAEFTQAPADIRPGAMRSEECLNACLGASENEGVDVVCAFVGIDDFEIDEMARNAEFVRDTVAAEHIAR
jgi:hypothetical protein